MMEHDALRLRVVACREDEGDGAAWSFYLLNESGLAIEGGALIEIAYQWGDNVTTENPSAPIGAVAPGQAALIWRGGSDGAEFRQDHVLKLRMGGREVAVRFEFPRLYKKRDLTLVAALGKRGWAVAPTR